MRKYIFGLLAGIVLMISCNEDQVFTPKPRMYPRVDFFPKAYKEYSNKNCNFTFEIPTYSEVDTNVKYFEEDPIHPCWFDLNFPDYNGRIYFSYTPVEGENTIDKLVTDAFKIASKHNSVAEYREELVIANDYGVEGVMFKIDGPVASPINFYLTDHEERFVRASLYFQKAVQKDSIAPILKYLEEDIDHLINTFQWK